MIAAAAAKPMTVLRIVLTPLLLEKPQPSEGNTAIPVVLPRAAIGVRGGGPRWFRRNLLLDHRARRSALAPTRSGRCVISFAYGPARLMNPHATSISFGKKSPAFSMRLSRDSAAPSKYVADAHARSQRGSARRSARRLGRDARRSRAGRARNSGD